MPDRELLVVFDTRQCYLCRTEKLSHNRVHAASRAVKNLRRHSVPACTLTLALVLWNSIPNHTETQLMNIQKVTLEKQKMGDKILLFLVVYFLVNSPGFDPKSNFAVPICHWAFHTKTCSGSPLAFDLLIFSWLSCNIAFSLWRVACYIGLSLFCYFHQFSSTKPEHTELFIQSFCGCLFCGGPDNVKCKQGWINKQGPRLYSFSSYCLVAPTLVCAVNAD